MSSEVLRSWQKNGDEWIKVLQEETIISRRVTNKAILDIILKSGVSKILDLGCGEGWLTHELNLSGKTVTGIDGTSQLIESALLRQKGKFMHLTFEDIIADGALPETYDAVVLNFCLYEKEATVDLLKTIKASLAGSKQVFIQTLHPGNLAPNLEYKDQWMEDAWKGLPGGFKDGHRWFYRTLQGWMAVFDSAGLQLQELYEPKGNSLRPVSIIFTLTDK